MTDPCAHSVRPDFSFSTTGQPAPSPILTLLCSPLRPGLSPPQVRLKALRAVSCMVRGDEQLADELAQQPSRVAAVVACLRPPSPVRVQIKAAHLLHHLVQRSVEFSTMVLDAENVVGALEVALLDDDNAQLWEQGLYLLVALGARRNSLLSTLQTDHSSLLERMGARRSVLTALPAEDKDAHREELDHMATLLGAMQM